MSSGESDVEMHRARKEISKKRLIKIPKSPTEETLEKEAKAAPKLTTGNMVENALAFLDTRKGVSLYAIKRYMEVNHQIDTEKNNHLIKRFIKTSIEKGTVLKTKGIGATGSFRLAPKKVVKPKKTKEITEKTSKKPIGTEKEKSKKKKVRDPKEKLESKPSKIKKQDMITSKIKKQENITSKSTKTKEKKSKKEGINKTKQPKEKKEKVSKDKIPAKKKKVEIKLPMTPALKKKILTKRKSIGSIIKPPKMKPKSMKSTKTKKVEEKN